MPTFIDGQQNLAALSVPGTYVDIIPPRPIANGAPTNIEGLVGVASWGPVNAPVLFATPDDCKRVLGVPMVRKHDIATFVWAATGVGGIVGFRGVRVTDGTDTAATGTLQGLTLTAKFTGSLGNTISVTLSAGTQATSTRATVSFNGQTPEVFNNIIGTGNAFWLALAAAINNGTPYGAPSNYVVAAATASIIAPVITGAAASVALTGGTDGASGVTDAMLVGSDVTPRTGMYALRGTGIDAFALCDLTDDTTWGVQDAFALSESALAVNATTSGDTISGAIAARNTVGLDDFPTWLLVGDWPSFYDTQNQTQRIVSPSAMALGLLGNLSPEQSPLNKILRGVNATQHSTANLVYSNPELQLANGGGVDLIVGPPTTPGGQYFSFATGRNASSNTGANGIEYSRMTNFLARSFQGPVFGSLIGRLQSSRPNDQTRQDATNIASGFLADLQNPALGSNGNGMIDSFSVTCDLTNNPVSLQARGFLFLYATVVYLRVVRYFVVKLAGGAQPQVLVQTIQPTPAQFA